MKPRTSVVRDDVIYKTIENAITAEFDEMRIALKLCRESQQEAER